MVSSSFLAGVIKRPTFSGAQKSKVWWVSTQTLDNVDMQPKEHKYIPDLKLLDLEWTLINNMHVILPPNTQTKEWGHSQMWVIAVDP